MMFPTNWLAAFSNFAVLYTQKSHQEKGKESPKVINFPKYNYYVISHLGYLLTKLQKMLYKNINTSDLIRYHYLKTVFQVGAL